MDWIQENLNSIILGDCYKVINDIPDKSIDCIYTDIPYLYNQSGEGATSALSKRIRDKRQYIKGISNGIDYQIFDEFIRVMKKVNCFIWCSKLQIIDIMNYFISYADSYELLVWCKTNPTPSTKNVWLPDIEYCLYFREKGITLNDGYEHKNKYYISALNKNDKELYRHPTIKPLPFVKSHLQHVTQIGDIILDPFSGSGTTCVAAKDIGRNFIGIEKDSKYHKISTDRINGITANGQISIFTNFNTL